MSDIGPVVGPVVVSAAPAATMLGRVRGFTSLTPVVVPLALAAGVVFRVFYPGVIEYHIDEAYSFNHVMGVLNGGTWPHFGMTMSVGGRNPGLSVWIFILLGLVTNPETPVDLARAVQFLNITALVAFIAVILRAIPRAERETWLWGAALWAVNPLAVIYERKIWPPSTLPIFIVAMLAGWWYRRSWLGSFAFALVTMLGGQIHPTAVFLGVSLFVWTIVDDRRAFRVDGLVTGAALGILPALNWLLSYSGASAYRHLRFPDLAFYGRWFTEPFGFGLDHTLGPIEFPSFLRSPFRSGDPTWLALAVHVSIAIVAAAIFVLAARQVYRSRWGLSLRWIFLGETCAGRLVRAALFGFGTILTALTIGGGGLYPHYLIVIAPLMTLWVASLVTFADGGGLQGRGRALLSTLCVLDGALVVMLFAYIHQVGTIYGEFGPSWEWQQLLENPGPPVIAPGASI
jgi:hypothetical protein